MSILLRPWQLMVTDILSKETQGCRLGTRSMRDPRRTRCLSTDPSPEATLHCTPRARCSQDQESGTRESTPSSGSLFHERCGWTRTLIRRPGCYLARGSEGALASVSAGRSEPGTAAAAAEDSGSIEELAHNRSCITARGLLIAEVTAESEGPPGG